MGMVYIDTGRIGVNRSAYLNWEKRRKAPKKGNFRKIEGVLKERLPFLRNTTF